MNCKPRIAAVIQARMGSTRLPGKVLKPISGMPLIGHIVHRLRKCRTVDVIAIATSTLPIDNPLEMFAHDHGIGCIRGSEDNVLMRFAQTAEQLDADVVVRICGDSPLVDPHTIDLLVEKLIAENADYCTGDPAPPRLIHEGFCVFSRQALERLLTEAPDDPAAREHITAYFKEHPESFNIAYIDKDPAHIFEGARLSIDTPADLYFMEELYRRLGCAPGDVSVADVVTLLRSCPELMQINGHIHQKKAREKTRRILFRCDGDEHVGLGHVVRCLALANELREAHGFGVTFALASGKIGHDMITQAGFPCEIKPAEQEEAAWLEALLPRLHTDAVILDIRTALSPAAVASWRSNGILTVTLDDLSERRICTDLAFYPPIPQLETMNWQGFDGRLFVGWEYILLRRSFACPAYEPANDEPVVLVSMGGSDPDGLIFKAIDALEAVSGQFQPILILGRAFQQRQALWNRLATVARSYQVQEDVTDMAALMAKVNLALISFGVTAYELAALGVPAIVLCLTQDHDRSASALVKAGVIVNLGVHPEVSPDMLADAVASLLKDCEGRATMRKLAHHLALGEGTQRVAEVISKTFGKTS